MIFINKEKTVIIISYCISKYPENMQNAKVPQSQSVIDFMKNISNFEGNHITSVVDQA